MRKSWLVLLALFVVLFVGSLTAFAAPRPNDPPPIGGGGTTYPSATFMPPSATPTPDLGTPAPTLTPAPTWDPLTPTPTRAGNGEPKNTPVNCDCIDKEN